MRGNAGYMPRRGHVSSISAGATLCAIVNLRKAFRSEHLSLLRASSRKSFGALDDTHTQGGRAEQRPSSWEASFRRTTECGMRVEVCRPMHLSRVLLLPTADRRSSPLERICELFRDIRSRSTLLQKHQLARRQRSVPEPTWPGHSVLKASQRASRGRSLSEPMKTHGIRMTDRVQGRPTRGTPRIWRVMIT